jgi:hypothetical protein
MTTVVILQSNFLPWRGYFDLLRCCDMFLILDMVQYTKNDWRNRNRIKTPAGPAWLTIPVNHKFSRRSAIDATRIADSRWVDTHIKTIKQNYSRAPCFDKEAPALFDQLRSLAKEECLSTINTRLLAYMRARIGIATPVINCVDIVPRDALVRMDPSERLLALCRECCATRYLSGPSAKAYLNTPIFDAAGIEVSWISYESYPEYPQLWGAFEPRLSIIDLLLNVGSSAASYISRS